MAYDVERRPAEWVSRRATRREVGFWTAGVFALAGCAALVAFERGHGSGVVGAALALALVVLFVALRRHAIRWAQSVLNWRKGAVAERAVGELLNELRHDGWTVMHDLEQAGEGNVDHLVSGPNGVYLVETKYRYYQPRNLTKAKRQAAKLHDELGVWVTPVVCLYARSDAPSQSKGVAVVPRRHVLGWLREQRNTPVEFERLARFADTV